MGLEDLNKKVEKDLSMIDYPPKAWRKEDDGIYDVVIIGAGMTGLTAAFALLKKGIFKIKLFDENPAGKEGPWATYARMKTLRSPKNWMGPALNVPSLSFRSFFEAQFGEAAWEMLGKIPTLQWMDYLIWFRNVLKLPVQNETKLLSTHPEHGHLKLTLSDQNVLTHKLVLATGRAGFGGPFIPDFIAKIPKSKWAHTNEMIDFKALQGKKVAIIGCGAAGFDAAATAIEHQAKAAHMFIRRDFVPNVNTGRELFFHGCYLGFYHLTDQERLNHLSHTYEWGSPPPREALERLKKCSNFHFHANADAEKILTEYDFIILATGLAIDGTKEPELAPLMDYILLWKDRGISSPYSELENSPYLGPHFEFLEKKKGKAPYLKNIHCFNYAAGLSHSPIASEIPPISYAAERLAEGITIDFYLKDRAKHYQDFMNYKTPEFTKDEFPFFHRP